jgi:D-alanyl-lipoteichoic acid acyltransferase DltB (MBOAT superfamily)
MNNVINFATKAYFATVIASPVIGANYFVYDSYTPEYTVKDFTINVLAGSAIGTAMAIVSPVIILGTPAYIISKCFRN